LCSCHKVDCIIENANKLIPIEIKSAKTINSDFFEGLNYWNKLSNNDQDNSYLVYAGDENQKRTNVKVISWKNIDEIPV
jgi:uncharacterized protein